MSWTAPELIDGKLKPELSLKVDVYSFAMVLYETIAHISPWNNVALPAVVSKVVLGQRPQLPETSAPAHYVKLMKECWGPAESRPNFVDILEKLQL